MYKKLVNNPLSSYEFFPIVFEVFNFFLLFCVFFPFFVFLVIFFFGYLFGDKGVSIFCIALSIFSWFLISVYISFITIFYFFYTTAFDFPEYCFGTWLSTVTFSVYWGFYFDPIAVIMIFVVVSITLIVQIYCLDYMWGDPFFSKFYAYLSLFSFFMLFLVSSNNYLQIFLGWEGVGLASFLLISFWNTRREAILAGVKAILVNRIGDLFFILSMLVISSEIKTLNFNAVFEYAMTGLSNFHINIFAFSLVIASMAKSAQLGLHVWLPDAMEGPTPVSALIHAATMVTAGIFVIIRSSPIVVLSSYTMEFMCFIGGLTALFGASVACVQFDIKKIIAYSTCSQLGYMLLACGCGNFAGAFFHLFTHAFFKALLFLSAGSVIHAVFGEQDIRKMGGLYQFLPFTYICIFFGSCSLAGFPFFSGFYSKDFILEYAYIYDSTFSYFGFWLGLVSVFFTAYYSFRLSYYVFFSEYAGLRFNVDKISEAPKFMTISMSILLFPTIFFGFLFYDFFVGSFSHFIWVDSISNFSNSWCAPNTFVIDNRVKQLPLIFSFAGCVISYVVNSGEYPEIPEYIMSTFTFKHIYKFLVHKWYFDEIYNFFTISFMKFIYNYFWLVIERGIFVIIGPKIFSIIYSFLTHIFDYLNKSVFKFKNRFVIILFSICFIFFAVILYFLGYLSLIFLLSIFFIFIFIIVISFFSLSF